MIFQKAVIKATQFVIKHKGLIMTVAAGLFEVGAVVTTAKQTIKAEKVLAPANEKITKIKSDMENTELILNNKVNIEESKKEIRKIQRDTFISLAKIYAVPSIMTMLSLTCIGGSYKVMRDKQIALAGAYMTLDKSFKAYRDRVKQRFGEDAEKDVYENAHYEHKTQVNPETGEVEELDELVRKVGDGGTYNLVYDASCGTWSRNGRTNWNTLMTIQKQLNLDLERKGFVFLSDVIDALGMNLGTIDKDLLAASRVVGWVWDPFDSERKSVILLGISDEYNRPNEVGNDLFNNFEKDAILTLNPDGIIACDTVSKKTGKKLKGFAKYANF